MLELDPKDVSELFGKFGPVTNVSIPENQKSVAFVVMNDYVAAYLAQQVLNMQWLESYQTKMFVKWCPEDSVAAVGAVAPADSLAMQRMIPIFFSPLGFFFQALKKI